MRPALAVAPRATDRWPVSLRLLSSVRFDEVLVLQGTPLFGALFSIGTPTLDKDGCSRLSWPRA
jgi:hypothetical protein